MINIVSFFDIFIINIINYIDNDNSRNYYYIFRDYFRINSSNPSIIVYLFIFMLIYLLLLFLVYSLIIIRKQLLYKK